MYCMHVCIIIIILALKRQIDGDNNYSLYPSIPQENGHLINFLIHSSVAQACRIESIFYGLLLMLR